MSMSIDHTYGYGFEGYCSDESLKNFIYKHLSTIETLDRGRELIEYTKCCAPEAFDPKEDFFDYENLETGECGIYGVIADVMTKETGVRFEYHRGTDDEHEAILFVEQFPWNLNSKEKTLTQDVLDEILIKYMREIGKEGKPDYIKIEYFG